MYYKDYRFSVLRRPDEAREAPSTVCTTDLQQLVMYHTHPETHSFVEIKSAFVWSFQRFLHPPTNEADFGGHLQLVSSTKKLVGVD